jgi:SSS family solute:Na+ symporter
MLGLFALGALTRRAHGRGAMIGIAACIVFTAWATLTSVKLPALDRILLDLGPLNYPLHPFLIGIFNHLIVLGVGYAASRGLPDAKKPAGVSAATEPARDNFPA